jgi:hypothetical protein
MLKGDLEINIRYPDGRTLTVNLANAYKDYSANPARLGELVKAYVAAWSRPPDGGPGAAVAVARSRIVPVVKDRQWLADLHATMRARAVALPREFLVEDFADELIVVYAEDDPNRTRYLTSGEIDMDRGELRKLALANVKPLLPKIEMRNHDDAEGRHRRGGAGARRGAGHRFAKPQRPADGPRHGGGPCGEGAASADDGVVRPPRRPIHAVRPQELTAQGGKRVACNSAATQARANAMPM